MNCVAETQGNAAANVFVRLAPKYEELARAYADLSDKVTVAKIDATANDIPDQIQGFPTIKLFPAGAKDSPVEYSGSRTVEDLAKFIAENGKHKAAVALEDTAAAAAPAGDVTATPPSSASATQSEEAAAKTDAAEEEAQPEAGEEAHDEL